MIKNKKSGNKSIYEKKHRQKLQGK